MQFIGLKLLLTRLLNFMQANLSIKNGRSEAHLQHMKCKYLSIIIML